MKCFIFFVQVHIRVFDYVINKWCFKKVLKSKCSSEWENKYFSDLSVIPYDGDKVS